MANAEPEPLLHPNQVAALLNVSLTTIKRWRLNGRGPACRRLSARTVRYAPEAVREYQATLPGQARGGAA
jgi:predicted DNA-binding transcriptional regulator AlpA